MDINISEANQFINLHAHPQKASGDDLTRINDWIEQYPYCQSLHFLNAKAHQTSTDADDFLAKAATFAPNREVLFQFIHHTESFETDEFLLDEAVVTENINSDTESHNDLDQFFGVASNKDEVKPMVAPLMADKKQDTENFSENGTEEVEIDEPLRESVIEEDESPSELIEESEAVAYENNQEDPEKEIPAIEPTEEAETADPIAEEEIRSIEIESHNDIADDVAQLNTDEEVKRIETVGENNSSEEIIVADDEHTDPVKQIVPQEPEALLITEDSSKSESIAEPENIDKEEPSVENIEEPAVEEEDQPATEQGISEAALAEAQLITNDSTANEVDKPDSVHSYAETKEEDIESIEANDEAVEEQENSTAEPISLSQDELVSEAEMLNEEEEETETAQETEVEKATKEPETTENEVSQLENAENADEKAIEKDELIFDSPIASDFFAFAKAEKPASVVSSREEVQAPNETSPQPKELPKAVSQYNDERLPYTFLWWLNKTRKEHATNTQPYAKTAKPPVQEKRAPAEPGLNHQIAENIFHLRGADEIGGSKSQNMTVPFDFRRKEFQIIEKFIKEEPQIKPPAANKIDTENKAKKSSEDANQVVSETLAKIYVEQMLYHKALDVYKKLSLKYPEKSTYFASQIKYLELKVN